MIYEQQEKQTEYPLKLEFAENTKREMYIKTIRVYSKTLKEIEEQMNELLDIAERQIKKSKEEKQ